MLYNRARQLDPDTHENFKLLRETIQLEAREQKTKSFLSRPKYLSAGMPRENFLFFSQNGQDRYIYEILIEPRLQVDARLFAGVFVEAGAVDGVTNSNTLFFERSLGVRVCARL
jgi:hypothetical protein